MADAETLAVYAARASDYAERFAEAKPGRHLTAFIDHLHAGARVLDLGCGPGRAAAYMRDEGLAVDAWDASPEMAELGREAFGLDIALRDFSDLDAEEVYDGIFANFSLLHAPKDDMPDHLTRIARALKPYGLLHVGLKTGAGEKRDALGRLYAYYQDAEISQLLDDVGLTVITRDFGADEGLDGTVAPWIILKARKTPQND